LSARSRRPTPRAGPLVTPTNPIFNSLSAACDSVALAAITKIEALRIIPWYDARPASGVGLQN
jgi:hypothetical protein